MEDQEAGEVAQEVSLEDRVANVIEPETAEEVVKEQPQEETEEVTAEAEETKEESEESETTESEFVDVEYEGQAYKVPPVLKDALMRNTDYTQKTTEIAEQRKKIDLTTESLKQAQDEQDFFKEIQPELNQLNQLDAYIAQYEALNWREMNTDEMVKTKFDLDLVEKHKSRLLEGLQGKQAEFKVTQQETRDELLTKGNEILSKTIPKWDKDTQEQLRDYGLSEGYSQQELQNLSDPIRVQTLYKAMQFDKLKAGTADTIKTVKATPTIKPKSSKPMSTDTKNYLAYRKNIKATKGNDHEAAKHVLDRIASKYG